MEKDKKVWIEPKISELTSVSETANCTSGSADFVGCQTGNVAAFQCATGNSAMLVP